MAEEHAHKFTLHDLQAPERGWTETVLVEELGVRVFDNTFVFFPCRIDQAPDPPTPPVDVIRLERIEGVADLCWVKSVRGKVHAAAWTRDQQMIFPEKANLELPIVEPTVADYRYEPLVEFDPAEPPAPVEAHGLNPYPLPRMGERPSYRYKLEESKRRRADATRAYGIRDPIWDINDKLKAYGFADRHGVARPSLFGSYSSIDAIVWDELPDSFVLKSRFGSSNRGVKTLVRDGADSFLDLLRDRLWTVDEIRRHQAELEANGQASIAMFSEELVWKVDRQKVLADDWKLYCFYGRVGLTMQRDLMGSGDMDDWRFKFWGRSWQDLGPVKFVDRQDSSLVGPRDGDAMVAVAERLSRIIRRPFIRIDMFESDRGPILGEFTPAPGPPEVFAPEIDEMLGRLWEDAEVRIFGEEVVSGAWDHLIVPGD